ncbi:MAG: hypothetical protein P8174_03280 [Gemmatimonadota bacterium]
MKKRAFLGVLVLAVLGLAACGSKDSTGPANQVDELVGTWFSGGSNVAPGLAAVGVDSILATFNEDQTYTVINYAGGSQATLTGTWQAGTQAEGQIRSITVDQIQPSALTAEGIFQVTGTAMTYEVIQVEPALQGVTAPTVSGGFGSTTIGGVANSNYIQHYVKRS